MIDAQSKSNVLGRVWVFAQFEYNEALRELRANGTALALNGKPLDLLVCLLRAQGAVVEKQKIVNEVWLAQFVSEDGVKTAVNSLRNALGDTEKTIIRTAHRIGYRIGVPLVCREAETAVVAKALLDRRAPIPGRPDWVLDTPLDQGPRHWVWLAKQRSNSQLRVFKFAEDGIRYAALQREITLSRLFARAAPKATCFVKIFDWQLGESPYYLESDFGGANLRQWATERRQLDGLPRELCLQLMADICDAVQISHDLSVFHNDLKPSNILISKGGSTDGGWHVKLADFGIATLLEPQRLSDFDITNHGFGEDAEAGAGGSAMYHAPEVKPGQPPTRSADIYALGVILFQLLSGDFRKTPVPGWEQDVDDPLLRDDIAQAVELDPARRLKSAAELGTRLRTLDARREGERIRQEAVRYSEELVKRDQRSRARRPYLQALFASLVLGLLSTGWFYWKAVRERRTTEEINSFLSDDLLSELNPRIGKGASETLRQAVQDVRPLIDTRFSAQPEVAARIHQTIALALDNAQDYLPSAEEYDRAADDWIRVEGPLSQDALFQQYQHVLLDARSFSPGSLDRAHNLQAKEDGILRRISRPWPKVRIVQFEAEGTIAMVEGKPKEAVNRYQEAVNLARKSPDISDKIRLTTKERLCHGEFRAEQAVAAEQCFREVIAEVKSLGGSDEHLVGEQVGIVQALRYQGRFEDVLQQINTIYPAVLKQLGPDADYPMVLLGMRAEAEAALEQWDSAIKDDLALAEHARNVDPKSFPAMTSLSDASLSECRSGRTEAGERHSREAIKAIDVPGGNPGFIGAFKEVLASCLIPHIPDHADPNRLNEAERLINGIDADVVSGSVGDAKWGANLDLDRAQIAYHRGQYALASRYLDAAKPGFMSPQADTYQKKAISVLGTALAEHDTQVARR